VNASLIEVKILDGFALLTGAKNYSERRLLRRLTFVAIEPAKIQLHLPRVGRLEVAEFEFDHDEPPQASMKKQ
jgi:hypothetical protein